MEEIRDILLLVQTRNKSLRLLVRSVKCGRSNEQEQQGLSCNRIKT
jgi:hypothetical protein